MDCECIVKTYGNLMAALSGGNKFSAPTSSPASGNKPALADAGGTKNSPSLSKCRKESVADKIKSGEPNCGNASRTLDSSSDSSSSSKPTSLSSS